MTQKEFEALSYQDRIKHNLPAIIAITKGESVEIKFSESDGYSRTAILNYIHLYPYRVKHVKKWVNIYLKNDQTLVQGFVYFSKEIADKNRYDNMLACVEIEVPVAS